MEHIAQGKRSDTLGLPHSRVSAPCKGKSFNLLCRYSYLIADLAVLTWNIVCIFCSTAAPCLKAFALTGRDCSNTRYPGCRFACPGLWAPLGFQPARVHAFCFLQNCLHSALLAIIVLIISAIRSVDNSKNNLHYHLHYLHT